MLSLLIIGIAVLSVDAPNPTTTPPAGQEPNKTKGSDGTVWVHTDVITIMANPQMPMFHFWYTLDDNGTQSKFSVTYTMLTEFEDYNNDSAFQSNELLYFAPFASYEWTLHTGIVEKDGVTNEVWLKYTKGGKRADGPLTGFPPAMCESGSTDRFENTTVQI